MRLAVQEDMLDGASVEERFNAAEALQLDGVELWTQGLAERVDKVRGLSRLMGLGVPAVSYSLRTSLLAHEEERRYTAAELRRLLGLCAKIGAKALIYVPAWGGPRLPKGTPPDRAAAEARKLLPEVLGEIARSAEAEGVRLLIEPVSRFESYALTTVQEAAELCRAIGSNGLGICANLYQMRVQGEEPATAFAAAGSMLGYVRVADRSRLPPGSGGADLGAELGALSTSGYDGYLGLEAMVPGQNAALRRFFARELPGAVEHLRRLLRS